MDARCECQLPINVLWLPAEEPPPIQSDSVHSQIRVHAGEARLRDRVREGREPPLRPPLLRVLAPQCLGDVAGSEVEHDGGALLKGDLGEGAAVDAYDGFGER